MLGASEVSAQSGASCITVRNTIERKREHPSRFFVELSDWQVFLHILQHRFPRDFICVGGHQTMKALAATLKREAAKRTLANAPLREQQALLDQQYFGGEKVDRMRALPRDDLYAYVFYRTIREGHPDYPPDRDFAARNKAHSQTYWGYYLTHVILYDSLFFARPLDAANYGDIITDLRALIPWVLREKLVDLAAEILLCLSFLGARTGEAYELLAQFIDVADEKNEYVDSHQMIVLLLAKLERSYQTPRTTPRCASALGTSQAYVFGANTLADTTHVVIGINGGPGWSHRALLPLVDLGRHVPVVLYDQLGVGASDKSEAITNNYDLESALLELDALVKTLPQQKVILLGHSFGSLVAYEYARRFPERIERLVLLSPFLSPSLWQSKATQLLEKLPLTSVDFATRNHAFNEAYVLTGYRRYLPYFGTPNTAIYERLFGKAEFDVSGSIRNYEPSHNKPLNVNALLLAGENEIVDADSLRTYQRLFLRVDAKTIPQAQHLFYFTHLGSTIEALMQFLQITSRNNAELSDPK